VNNLDKWGPLGWKSKEKILIYGIGNVARQDDGLGVRFIEKLESLDLPSCVSLDENYQLNIEDALLISGYDVVLFVDAARGGSEEAGLGTGLRTVEQKNAFSIQPIQPSSEIAFSTHAMSFGGVLALCIELYGQSPRTFLLSLPGYQWEIGEEMSVGATENLEQAFQALRKELSDVLCMKSPS
jgi:hydrogenase maturation protease